MKRRHFLQTVAAAACGAAIAPASAAEKFKLRYMLASSMYGQLPLASILPEVKKTGATSIDLWPKVHGAQREEVEAMGLEKFKALLAEHGIGCGCITRFDLGAFRLDGEIEAAHTLGAKMLVVGSGGDGKQTGDALKAAVKTFAEKLKPVGAKAAERGVTVAIENHGRTLIESPDSLRWLAELAPPGIGIAFAPYHLPQVPAALATLIHDLAPKLSLFYAWEYGMSCAKAMPKEEELQQMPGRGKLDFKPLLAALAVINFTGPTEIFMHPTPRGIPILPTVDESTAEINRARTYLEGLLN